MVVFVFMNVDVGQWSEHWPFYRESPRSAVWANKHIALTASLKNVSTFPETSRGLRAAKDKIHSDLNSLSSLFNF